MQIEPFDSTEHRIGKCKINNYESVCLIDDKVFFGTDWTVPVNELVGLSLNIGSICINLDVSSMYNPWLGNAAPKKQFKIEVIAGGYLVRGLFSDGAASYIAEWKIINGKSIRTLIDNNENLVLDFLEN